MSTQVNLTVSFQALAFLVGTLILFPVFCHAQYEASDKIDYRISVSANFANNTGETAALYNRKAQETSQNWGINALYSNKTSLGWNIDAGASFFVSKCLFLGAGVGFQRLGGWDEMTYQYDPIGPGGITESTLSIRDRFLHFTSHFVVGGNWKGFSLSGGINTNIFLSGNTSRILTESTNSGTVVVMESEAKLDIQDQPIYYDPEATGGIRDYTSTTGKNHGVNPVSFDLNINLKYDLFSDKNSSTFVSIGYKLPINDLKRSQNPSWSLSSITNPPSFPEINSGTRMQVYSIGLGYVFY